MRKGREKEEEGEGKERGEEGKGKGKERRKGGRGEEGSGKDDSWYLEDRRPCLCASSRGNASRGKDRCVIGPQPS